MESKRVPLHPPRRHHPPNLGVSFLLIVLCAATAATGCIRKRGPPQSEDLSPDGYYLPRSPYQRRSVYGPEGWKRRFLLPREDQPRLTSYSNGTKILERCRTTEMFSLCADAGGCGPDYPSRFTFHTGQSCFRHSCNDTLTCQGIHCRCCERINCTVQADQLKEVSVPGESFSSSSFPLRVRSVENCTRDSLSSPCPLSEGGPSRPGSPPGGRRCKVTPSARRRIQTFLNATCSPLSCKSFRRCEGLSCQCCQLFTCVARPNETDSNLDFPGLNSEDQNILDLFRLRKEKESYVKNDDFNRKRYHYYYSRSGLYSEAVKTFSPTRTFLSVVVFFGISVFLF